MGAESFEDLVYGYEHTPQGMERAYSAAVADAVSEFGTDGYNGTISTTRGVRWSPLYSGPVRSDQIDYGRVMDRAYELNEREACEAIPVREVSDATRKPVADSVLLDSFSIAYDRLHEYGALKAAARKKVLSMIRSGAEVTSRPWDGTSEKVSLADLIPSTVDISFDYGPRVLTSAKAEFAVPKEKTETRYFIVDEYGRMPRWEKGYSTQALARRAIAEHIEEPGRPYTGRDLDPYEVVSMTRRVSGKPLLTAREVWPKNVKVQLKVDIYKITEKPKLTGQTGWLFYGMAAS